MNRRAKAAKKHLAKLCELVAKRPSPFAGLSHDQVIEELRKTREKLWEKKLGIRA